MNEALGAKVAAGVYGVGQLIGAAAAPDINVVLNILALLALLVFGPRYLKVRDLQSQIAAKNQAIATNEQSIEALTHRVSTIQEELRGAQERGNLAEERAHRAEQREAEWKSRYDEAAKYTAAPAFAELKEILAAREEHDKTRYGQLLELMARLAGEKSVTELP